MITEIIPIVAFVNKKVLMPPVKPLIEPLAIDITVVANILIGHFHEMGIFFVPPGQDGILLKHMVRLMKTSPEIHKIVIQAAHAKARAKPKRA